MHAQRVSSCFGRKSYHIFLSSVFHTQDAEINVTEIPLDNTLLLDAVQKVRSLCCIAYERKLAQRIEEPPTSGLISIDGGGLLILRN